MASKRNEITVLETPPPPLERGRSKKSSAAASVDIDDDDEEYMPAVFRWLSVEVPVFFFALRDD